MAYGGVRVINDVLVLGSEGTKMTDELAEAAIRFVFAPGNKDILKSKIDFIAVNEKNGCLQVEINFKTSVFSFDNKEGFINSGYWFNGNGFKGAAKLKEANPKVEEE